MFCLFFSSRRRHTICALVTGVQTCALPIWFGVNLSPDPLRQEKAANRVERKAPRYFGCLTETRPRAFFIVSDHLRLGASRSEEHTSELQSLMRISYAVFCLKKKNRQSETLQQHLTTVEIITKTIVPNTQLLHIQTLLI